MHEVAGQQAGAFVESHPHEAGACVGVDGLSDVIEFARKRTAALIAKFNRIGDRDIRAVQGAGGGCEDDAHVVMLRDCGEHGVLSSDE